MEKEELLQVYRHSLAHILAKAVIEIYGKEVQYGIGPQIEDGCYYDFVLPEGITGPLPADVADHVAAVALFGKPTNGFMNTIQSTAPPITIGHRYTAKTVEMCVDGDPVCSADPGDASLHSLYASNGMADQAASFVAQRVNGR